MHGLCLRYLLRTAVAVVEAAAEKALIVYYDREEGSDNYTPRIGPAHTLSVPVQSGDP